MGKEEEQKQPAEVAQGDANAPAHKGPLKLVMAPDRMVLAEARKLVADPTVRVEDLSVCMGQDPIIVMELLKTANAMFFSGGRAAITSTKTAAIRLGNTVLMEMLDKLKERESIEDPGISHWFELHRVRSRRASIVATIIGEALARTLVEDCQVASLLQFTGDMLAVMHLEDDYVRLATEVARGSMNYRLVNDHHFDVERMCLSYLTKQGVPEGILFVFDREARPRQAERAIIRPISIAAAEFVDAFDGNRLEKFAPGKNLPPKSAVRSLQFNDQQYLKIYERIAEFLFSYKMIEEKRKKAPPPLPKNEPVPEPQPEVSAKAEPIAPAATGALGSLDDEINQLLSGAFKKPDFIEPDPTPTSVVQPPVLKRKTGAPETVVKEVATPLAPQGLNDFSLSKAGSSSVARVVATAGRPVVEPPKIHTSKGTKYLAAVSGVFSEAKSSEELLSGILAKLVKPEGPFVKAALIVVSKDRKQAIVVAARGPNLGNGQRLELSDPLNPLAQCFSRVQSFGRDGNQISPFGSRSFAVAPLDVVHDTPVALYADCGEDGSLTFEARRIFRNVIELLNARLPELPGGIPNELRP